MRLCCLFHKKSTTFCLLLLKLCPLKKLLSYFPFDLPPPSPLYVIIDMKVGLLWQTRLIKPMAVIDGCHLPVFWSRYLCVILTIWISATLYRSTQRGGTFVLVFTKTQPQPAIMVTPAWKEEENGRKSFHNTASCLCGKARFNPQNFPPSEVFIQAWNNSSGISLRPTDAACYRFIFVRSWSDLLYI